MNKHAVLFPALLILSGSLYLSGAQTITVDRRSALCALAAELDHRYGYSVTYEEGPYDAADLREETMANGKRFLSPVWKPIVFQIPDALAAAPAEGTADVKLPNPIPSLGPEILDPLVRQYNESGNPGKFSVIYEGEYAHIVQVTRVVDRRTEDFQPILSTKVAFAPETRSCFETLNDLFRQISTARGARIANATRISIGTLSGHRCAVVGDNLTARDVLEQILNELGTSPVLSAPRDRFAWALMYEPNLHKYFLSTSIVPKMTPHGNKAPVPAASQRPPATTSSPGEHGLYKATPIKNN